MSKQETAGIRLYGNRSSPFKGEARWGMGLVAIALELSPIPTLTLPLKGRGSSRIVHVEYWE
jgi:hypothetical protein